MARAKLSERIDIRVTKRFKALFGKVASDRQMKDSDLGRKALERLIAESETETEKKAA